MAANGLKPYPHGEQARRLVLIAPDLLPATHSQGQFVAKGRLHPEIEHRAIGQQVSSRNAAT